MTDRAFVREQHPDLFELVDDDYYDEGITSEPRLKVTRQQLDHIMRVLHHQGNRTLTLSPRNSLEVYFDTLGDFWIILFTKEGSWNHMTHQLLYQDQKGEPEVLKQQIVSILGEP